MTHPYPRLCPSFDYVGAVSYFVTFKTYEREPRFRDVEVVNLVFGQFLKAAADEAFEMLAYCFMPDHVHLVVSGRLDTSDAKAFFKRAKQYSGFHYARRCKQRLWQRYCHDRIIRDDVELLDRLRYVVRNPLAAGIVACVEEYPFWGSSRWTRDELLAICERGLESSITRKADARR